MNIAPSEVQPELREGLREPALRAVDEERADDRADQRAAAADRGPDRDLDRRAPAIISPGLMMPTCGT